MKSPLAYALQFRGETVSLEDGRVRSETRAPSCVLVTVVGRDGLDGRFQEIGAGEAICKRELVVAANGSVSGTGQVYFGAAGSITFLVRGEIAASPDPRLRHGTAVCAVTGGRGLLAGAHGFVTSNFLLSETGDLTDHHLGLLFVEQAD